MSLFSSLLSASSGLSAPASTASSNLFADLNFVLARQLIDSPDPATRSLCDRVVAAIVSHGGVVDAEIDVPQTTHLIVPKHPHVLTPPTRSAATRAAMRAVSDAEFEPGTLTDEEVVARNSRLVNVVYPQFVLACMERGAVFGREEDEEGELLLFDCTVMMLRELRRAKRYADRQLLEAVVQRGDCSYDPDDPDALPALHRRLEEERQQREKAKAKAKAEKKRTKRGKAKPRVAEEEEEEREVEPCAVSSMARRCSVQVGEVVKVGFIAGDTQRKDWRKQQQRRQRQLVDTDDEDEEGEEDEEEEEEEPAGEQEENSDAEEEQEKAGEAAEEAAKDEEDREGEEDAEAGAEQQRGNSDDVCELSRHNAHLLPWEDDIPPFRLDDGGGAEKAFLRIVDRVVCPNHPDTATAYIAQLLHPLRRVHGAAQYGKIRIEPCNIFTVTPLFKLNDCEQQAGLEPDTFHIPPLEERVSVRAGRMVKCILQQESNGGRWLSEELWLRVRKVERRPAAAAEAAAAVAAYGPATPQAEAGEQTAGSGGSAVRYRARLWNAPVILVGMPMLEEHVVEPRHICDIDDFHDCCLHPRNRH